MKYKISTIILRLYYLLFFLTPLAVYHKTSELFEFNKLLLIYLSAGIVLFFWVLQIAKDKSIIIKKTFLDRAIIIFLFSQLLSTVFSIDRHTSVFGYYGRFNGGLLSLIAYLFLFYGLVNFLMRHYPDIKDRFSYLKRLMLVALSSSFVVILWGLPGRINRDLSCWLFTGVADNSCWTEQFRPAERMFSTLGQPNWLGAYLAICFFAALFFYRTAKHKLPALLYLVINFSSILFTRSRSAILAVITGFIFFLVFIFKNFAGKKNFSFSKMQMFLLAAAVILPIILFKTGIAPVDKYLDLSILKKTSQVQKTEQEKNPAALHQNNVTGSLDIRKIVWDGAIALGFRYPLFGTGVETFAYSYYLTRPAEHNLTSEWDFIYNKAHNEFLNYFATSGFIGLFAYLFYIFSVYLLFIRILKNEKKQKDNKIYYFALAVIIAYTTINITNFFGFSTTVINMFFYLLPAFIIVLDRSEESDTNLLDLKLPNLGINFLYLLSPLLLIATLYFTISYFLADINYAKAEGYSRLQDYPTAQKYMDKAYRLRKEHVYEDKMSQIYANLSFLQAIEEVEDESEKMQSEAVANQYYELSEYYSDRSIKRSPKNPMYYKSRAKNQYLFYSITRSQEFFDNALKALGKAQELAPTDPKVYYSQALFGLYKVQESAQMNNEDQLKKLLKIANRAIELKENYRDGYYVRALIYKELGDAVKARSDLQYILDNINKMDTEIEKELQQL